jgi:hypothetical protein
MIGLITKRVLSVLLVVLSISLHVHAQEILIPMDAAQKNHLKAYGVVFNALTKGQTAQWLLNYRGGSFMLPSSDALIRESLIKGVSIEQISTSQAAAIVAEIERPDVNMAVVPLEKAPRIAVYTPQQALPWDDAVTLALTYAEVPYDKIWDREVIGGELSNYDWLHLHHEDFTGQYGKFYASYGGMPWYIRQVREMEAMAKDLGFNKVSELKGAVAQTLKEYIGNGGFLFSMCSGTDSFDIALAAQGVDMVGTPYDGDPHDPDIQKKLNYDAALAFENFTVITDPMIYEYSDIDIQQHEINDNEMLDFFTLFEFSAKYDPVPTMLTQNHVSSVRGFFGQTTMFRKSLIKDSVVILAEKPGMQQVKYLHGNYGRGTFTFYAGHDPEDYKHRVDDPPTDLDLHPNSPGYRLILNNILFPAAKKKEKKT